MAATKSRNWLPCERKADGQSALSVLHTARCSYFPCFPTFAQNLALLREAGMVYKAVMQSPLRLPFSLLRACLAQLSTVWVCCGT